MSDSEERKIIVTGQDAAENTSEDAQEGGAELTYNATEADEERFFLMYNMNFQPSEVENLNEDYRRWLIARFIHQKKMEQAMMQEAQIRQRLAGDLSGGPRPGGGPGLNLVR